MAHFHCTYDYVLNGLPWPVWQMMMSDLPTYKSKDEEEEVAITSTEDLRAFAARINNT